MKTIRRIMIVAGIVFTAVFLTAACDDDDKNDQTTVIGTWNLVESKADVTPVATATQTEEQLESQIANYLLIAVNSRIVITNKSVTFPLSVNGGTTQSKTYQYVLNDGIMSIASPMAGGPDLLGDIDLTDNVLKITFAGDSYMKLLQALAAKDATFKTVVDQIASASIYYRMKRIN
mgnify:FL=1